MVKLGKPERRLIIICDGETRASDFALASSSTKYTEYMLVNKVIQYHGNIKWHHWVSYHPEVFTMVTDWCGITHSNLTTGFRPKCLWKHVNEGGTSGLFALNVAMYLGYNKICLVGCPLSGQYGHETVVHPWIIFKGRNVSWCTQCVRSFSGKTLELLGDAKGWW